MITGVKIDCSKLLSMSYYTAAHNQDDRGLVDGEVVNENGGVLYLNSKTSMYDVKLIFPDRKDVDMLIGTLQAFRDQL